ncbi:hypothetical protein SAMN05428936_10697 [Pelagibacterium halotolerans]|nr:hypothetical protein SAMN05428936_10697 [Pelagibacterium halotolerans]
MNNETLDSRYDVLVISTTVGHNYMSTINGSLRLKSLFSHEKFYSGAGISICYYLQVIP